MLEFTSEDKKSRKTEYKVNKTEKGIKVLALDIQKCICKFWIDKMALRFNERVG